MKNIFTLSIGILLAGILKAQVPTNGLISWYPFNNSINDTTVNSNNLALTYANGGLNYVAGHNGAAASFYQGGNCEILHINSVAGLNNNSFTIAGWFNFIDSAGTLMNIMVGRNEITNFPTFSMEYYNNGTNTTLNFYTYYDNTYTYYQQLNVNITNDLEEWHHVAFSFQGGDSLKAYYDGALVPATALPTISDTLNNTVSRYEMGASGNYCNAVGTYDDFMIYNRALTASEVHDIYGVNNLSAESIANNSAALNLYPNPATDVLNIFLSGNENIDRVEILSVDGKLVQSNTHVQHVLKITDLSPGVYMLRAWVNGAVAVKRFIKQ